MLRKQRRLLKPSPTRKYSRNKINQQKKLPPCPNRPKNRRKRMMTHQEDAVPAVLPHHLPPPLRGRVRAHDRGGMIDLATNEICPIGPQYYNKNYSIMFMLISMFTLTASGSPSKNDFVLPLSSDSIFACSPIQRCVPGREGQR